ncbi:hypothetical protein TREMEDRAFT_61899 [Tremella mesenterica DSM 1558]|uniref:uncharacterized protein n=1 Tax=Tremella mesenterica (strain ATCC 24925 / CBS 8224 / DSM 1558 / NBRC 9311 / NRRL Y-6157 / RJB 2259-6 / UBC 559-6) TaxID=578456 RepID=UPI0003F4A548|nr:uncharacterized protein TREMEDRAFT_61899 [Tremella mesenterica DSM 1558]EIW70138.1 hypothetical protein TREMEDRAFT_61899 [Tremella mesenterica DSM 1558]
MSLFIFATICIKANTTPCVPSSPKFAVLPNKTPVRVTTAKYAVVTPLSTPAPSRLGETSIKKDQVSRGSSTVGLLGSSCSTGVTVSRIALTDDPCEPRRSKKILWSQIGELREQLGVEDSVGGSIQGDEFAPPLPSNPPSPSGNALPPIGSPVESDRTPRAENTGSTTNLGEEGTQGVILALMQMVANMNKDMMEERRRREEWEQRRERETRMERKEEKRGEGRQTSAQSAVQATITPTQVKNIPSNADELRRQWPRPSPELWEARKKEGKCTECGEKGHWLRDCPVRAAKVKVGWLPPWGEKFGERGGGSGGNAVPLGQRRNLNAVGGDGEMGEDQGKEEDLSQ